MAGLALLLVLADAALSCPSPSIDASWAKRSDRDIVGYLQATRACVLDARLTSVPFSEWLIATVGSRSSLRWTIEGGCLLKPGGSPPAEFPLCVQVLWNRRGKGGGQIMVPVGAMRPDGKTRLDPPAIEWLVAFGSSTCASRQLEEGDPADLPAILAHQNDCANHEDAPSKRP
jgi:hypothetical protein